MKNIIFALFIFFAFQIGNAYASPNSDLVLAVNNADLEGMNNAFKLGADSNVMVCFIGNLMQLDSSEDCLKGEKLHLPLIWGTQNLGNAFPEKKFLPVLKLLAKNGARSDFYALRAGGKVQPEDVLRNPIHPLLPLRSGFNFNPGGNNTIDAEAVDRALVIINAGYAPSKIILNKLRDAIPDLNESIRRNGEGSEWSKPYKLDKSVVESFLKAIEQPEHITKILENNEAKRKAEVERLQEEVAQKTKADEARRKVEAERLKAEAARLRLEAEQEAKQQVIELEREAKQQAIERKQIASFRKSIKEGDETNCGPIIDIKGKLTKISFPVANYGNEHWIRRDELFPSGYGCRFVNGQYQAPQQ